MGRRASFGFAVWTQEGRREGRLGPLRARWQHWADAWWELRLRILGVRGSWHADRLEDLDDLPQDRPDGVSIALSWDSLTALARHVGKAS